MTTQRPHPPSFRVWLRTLWRWEIERPRFWQIVVFLPWVVGFLFSLLEWALRWAVYFIRWVVPGIAWLVAFLVAAGTAYTVWKDIAERKKARQYQAWQLIHAAQGQKVSSARIMALEDLNADGVRLDFVQLDSAIIDDIKMHHARMDVASLKGARLDFADFSNAKLRYANFAGAHMAGANFTSAALKEADLSRASVSGTIFRGAEMWNVKLVRAFGGAVSLSQPEFVEMHRPKLLLGPDFTGADLFGADFNSANMQTASFRDACLIWAYLGGIVLEHADLTGANLETANLESANLARAKLDSVTLLGADLRYAVLRDVTGWRSIKSIEHANIFGVREAPAGFEAWADSMGAVPIQADADWFQYSDYRGAGLPRQGP